MIALAVKPKSQNVECVPHRANNLTIEVARDLDALVRVMALRAVVYMAEQDCPFDEEFDGNDFAAATHLLAKIDGEPVGTLRLRWFADFVKFERAAVKRGARGGAVIRGLLHHAIDISRQRGYQRALAHMQVRLAPLWRTYGFEPRDGRDPFYFSDHEYMEGEAHFTPHPSPLNIDSSPFVLMRPEGLWDRPGVLDESTHRGAREKRDD